MQKKIISGILGILIALLIGAVIMLVRGFNPIETYGALFGYSLFGLYPLATTLTKSVPLILTGLSASIAFASGPVNLGQPGQLLMGALFAAIGGLYIHLPPALELPILILLSMLGGALWSGVAAFFKRAFNMDEFITTLMLNMIADFLTYWAISYPLYDSSAFSPMTPQIDQAGWMPEFGEFNTSVIVMLLAFIVAWFVFNRFTAGYEWRLTGQNSLFSRLGGVKIDRNYVTVMLVTGALAGLAGGMILMAGPHRFLKGLGANYAWDGVMVAVVANNGLIGTLLFGLFFSSMQAGALGMELITAVPSEFIQVLQAVIVLVIVAGRGSLDLLLDRLTIYRQAAARSGSAQAQKGTRP